MPFLVDTNQTLDTSLISYWKLDEFSSAGGAVTRVDSKGTNHLTDNNTTASAVGKRGNGADLERSNSESLSIVNNVSLQTGAIDFSLACWINIETSTPAVYYALISKFVSGAQEYWLGIDPSDKVYWEVYNGVSTTRGTVISDSALSASTWYFIYAQYNSAVNVIAISINNGTLKTTGLSGSVGSSLTTFRIGAEASGVYFDGIIDEVGFWKKILTPQEITDLYNGGNGNTLLSAPSWKSPLDRPNLNILKTRLIKY